MDSMSHCLRHFHAGAPQLSPLMRTVSWFDHQKLLLSQTNYEDCRIEVQPFRNAPLDQGIARTRGFNPRYVLLLNGGGILVSQAILARRAG
jgi:hypothetical protein